MNKIKETENATLKTFKEEVPSNYYQSDDRKGFEQYVENMRHTFMHKYKFPPKLFKDAEVIDFGAGTGHKAINFATWGAKCTLVELSDRSSSISKDLFKNFAKNYSDHRFFNKSIFDYEEENKQYDIVHCVGVLSHTAAKEEAFKKICKFVKKGGFLIFGDPNKSGGFQNMLQRYALYKFSKNDEEICKNSEVLFKEDIDRSEKAVKRTRKEIIYDRWVIQSQDDPSFSEVLKWMEDCNLKFYSSYPNYPDFLISDSFYNKIKTNFSEIKNLPVLAELMWMTKTEDDKEFLKHLNDDMVSLNEDFNALSSYMANCNIKTKIETDKFFDYSDALLNTLNKENSAAKLKEKVIHFIKESKDFIKLVNDGNFEDVKQFLENRKYLFKGPVGIRHVDFIAYKEN